jgi:uncharacterized protein
MPHQSPEKMFRPALYTLFRSSWMIAAIVLLIHSTIRFGGLWDARLIGLALILMWPLPWLLMRAGGRNAIGLRRPSRWQWWLVAPLVGLLLLVVNAAVAWLLFGAGENNWFVSFARETVAMTVAEVPAEAPLLVAFLIVALPAMLISPLAEEFIFRGFVMTAAGRRWSPRVGMMVQAAAFAVVHLAHYGLVPFQPLLLLLWLPAMFFVSLVFGWLVWRSRSLWTAVVAHSAFNLGMVACVFLFLPEFIGYDPA